MPGAREVSRHDRTIVFALTGEPDQFLKALADHHVVALGSREADLEGVFLALYKEPPDAA